MIHPGDAAHSASSNFARPRARPDTGELVQEHRVTAGVLDERVGIGFAAGRRDQRDERRALPPRQPAERDRPDVARQYGRRAGWVDE